MKTFQLSIAFVIAIFLCCTAESFGQNLLQNGSFNTENPQGRTSSFSRTQKHVGGGQSGAYYWTTWANTMGSSIETELMPSSWTGGGMLRVSTNGVGNGIVQVFAPLHEGPEVATACVWIFIERGEVGVGVGNGGNTHTSMTLAEPGKWERIIVSNAVSPANEIIIYATSKIGADFYVEKASVVEGPPWEVDCCRPE